jgi:hypothetical protein
MEEKASVIMRNWGVRPSASTSIIISVSSVVVEGNDEVVLVPRRRDRLLVDESPRRDIITTEGGVHAFDDVVAVNARPAMPAMGTPAMRNGFMLRILFRFRVFLPAATRKFKNVTRRV